MTVDSESETRRRPMKKTAPIVLGTLASIVAAASTPVAFAHGAPDRASAMIAAALRSPLVVKGDARLTIVHIRKGCHAWSSGEGAPAAGVKIVLERGHRVTLVNQDLDQHKLVRLSGPKMALGKTLRMNDRVTLRFRQAGVYRLRTVRVESPGMPEVETMGADNILAMLVVVR